MKKLILSTLVTLGLIGSAGAQNYTIQQITHTGSFLYPHVGAIASNGTIFVGDLYSIHEIDKLGNITSLAGGTVLDTLMEKVVMLCLMGLVHWRWTL